MKFLIYENKKGKTNLISKLNKSVNMFAKETTTKKEHRKTKQNDSCVKIDKYM